MSQKSKLYADYDNQPFISDSRNLRDWEDFPEKYPYKKVERKQMVKVEEGLFPGDIVMLWRIGFDNFTNESTIPDYFEYRYGISAEESLNRLRDGGFIEDTTAMESLNLLNAACVKRILRSKGLPVGGKKQELLERVYTHFTESELEELFSLRKYLATPAGRHLIGKYDDIIQAHGPKNL